MNSLFRFPERPATQVRIHMRDCRDVMEQYRSDGTRFDAIITDPPYELDYMGKNWDSTGISFSARLWQLFYDILKPGGFVAAFAAARLYHRMTTAAEDGRFQIYPFLTWQFDGGLPKPTNVSELFDRDVLPEREIVGYRYGSGYTAANVVHGTQNRSTTRFPIYARHVSPEAQEWNGYYYGLNCMRPAMEPIMLAQRPIDCARAIDNLRQWRTGALNLGALKERRGAWPTTIFQHAKAKKSDHRSTHPSVKPVALLEDLCLLVCPAGGEILDPFAGTGTTGVAAQLRGFPCTLIESNPEMESVISRRLAEPYVWQ